MVTSIYEGRGGNNLFQYAAARLLAKKNELNLLVKQLSLVKVVQEYVNKFKIPAGEEVLIRDMYRDNHILNPLEKDFRNKNVKMHGFFQNAAIYNDHRDEIREWFEPCTREPLDRNVIVMHVRLTDYWGKNVNSVIHPAWYQQALAKLEFSPSKNKLVIVTEKHLTSVQWLSTFKRFAPEFVSTSAAEDFNFIRSAKNIICSNSSFAWWAAFLSNADKVVTFGPWLNPRRFSPINLSNMVGAIKIPGAFYSNYDLMKLDWNDYWKEKESSCI